ncbi:MAG: LAGLIDADG family homing endonuclease [Cellulophaga sp.]|nr:LAGLIDADG family homing endonuclease [Cellulophaga sp.]
MIQLFNHKCRNYSKNSFNTGINCLIKINFIIKDLKLRINKNFSTKITHISSDWFYEWLVGFTDGDGTFTIDRQKNGTKWGLVYKVSQKNHNPKILYFIKKRLGCGHVSEPADGTWYFRIRDRDQIATI